MLPFEKIKSLEDKLHDMLPKLRAGIISCIEYGDPAKPNGPFTALRITYIATVGGFQFRIRQVIFGRGDATLAYVPTIDECIKIIIDHLIRYHAPSTLYVRFPKLTNRDPNEELKLDLFEVVSK